MKTQFIYGKTGSGKTIYAIIEGWQDWLKGRLLMGNLHIKIPNSVFIEPVDIIRALNPNSPHPIAKTLNNNSIRKTLILDEVGKWWDSRTSTNKINRWFAYFVDQCRKRNIDLIIIDQHLGGFDIRGRQLVDKLIRCVGMYDETVEPPKPIAFKYKVIDLDNETVNKFAIPASIAKFFYPLYDTMEHVLPIEKMEIELVGEEGIDA